MKKLFVFAILSLLLMSVSGQDNPYTELKSNELGLHVGACTGMGMSYRHWFDKIGFQLTALPIKTDEFTFVSAGATALFSFYDSRYVMVFGYLGSHYLLRDDYEEYYDPYSGIPTLRQNRIYLQFRDGSRICLWKSREVQPHGGLRIL